jgi:acyl-coenzyme A synthetase/AMP-(fatty) acid ligase
VEVETRLVELEYVSEACIVSIPDKDASTRIAAVIRFQPGCYKDLSTVREATVIGKVIRGKVVQRYFPSTGSYELPPGVETWDINQKSSQPKPWDWAGLQGC